MQTMTRFRLVMSVACAFIGVIGALALLWMTRREPLTLPPLVYLDALGAFFVFATWGGLALWSALHTPAEQGWRFWLTALLLTVAFVTSLTPVIIAVYVLLALIPVLPVRRSELLVALGGAIVPLLAAAALAIGYGVLALRGAGHVNAPLAGAALDSFAFWCVLLSAAIPLLPFVASPGDLGFERIFRYPSTRPATHVAGHDMRSPFVRAGAGDTGSCSQTPYEIGERLSPNLFAYAWLYPLMRLYTLSPWNEGWSFATLTLGGGAMLWLTLGALTTTTRLQRAERNRRRLLAIGLAGIGLSSGAGLAAGCYAVLVYLLLIVTEDTGPETKPNITVWGLPLSTPSWLLSGAIPLTAPFIATWMIVGAGAAGGVTILTAVAWLTMLVGALPFVIDPPAAVSHRRWIGGALSSRSALRRR